MCATQFQMRLEILWCTRRNPRCWYEVIYSKATSHHQIFWMDSAAFWKQFGAPRGTLGAQGTLVGASGRAPARPTGALALALAPKGPHIYVQSPYPPLQRASEKALSTWDFPWVGSAAHARASPYILYTSNAVCSRPRRDSPLKRGCTLQKAGEKKCQEII